MFPFTLNGGISFRDSEKLFGAGLHGYDLCVRASPVFGGVLLLFKLIQVVLILTFSAGILFLIGLFFQFVRARADRLAQSKRMQILLDGESFEDALCRVFDPLCLYVVRFTSPANRILFRQLYAGKKFGIPADVISNMEHILQTMQDLGVNAALMPARKFSSSLSGIRWKDRGIFLLNAEARHGPVIAFGAVRDYRALPQPEHLEEFRLRLLRHTTKREMPHNGRNSSDSSIRLKKQNEDLKHRLGLLEVDRESKKFAMLQIAHDMRIPVASLRLIRENLDAEWEITKARLNGSRSAMDGLLKRLRTQVENLELFASSYLDLESDLILPPAEEFDLDLLWQSLLEGHSEDMKAKRLLLKSDASPRSHPCKVPRIAAMRIMENLISNAIKFSEPGGTLYTSVTGDGKTTTVELEDSGPGIPIDAQDSQFELARGNLGRGGGGYGLGLAAARQLARMLEGSLVAAPPVRGRGARFLLVIPTNL